MVYALDTNVLVDILRGNNKIKQRLSEVHLSNRITIPPYSYYEVLRGLKDRNANRQLSDFRLLQKILYKPDIDENDVMEKAAEIYIQRKKSGLFIGDDVDILIAAWCITADATLVTSNTKHFTDIDGLMIENWCE